MTTSRPENAPHLEALLDVFVYAPIGFLLDARELVPQLASRGRAQVELLKVGAKLVAAKGRFDADRKLAARRSTESEPAPATANGGVRPARPKPATAPPAESRTSTRRTAPTRPKAQPTPAAKAPRADQLAIHSYDTLSASQIVPRLATLSPDDLALIARYETANRGRRTILNRVEQLRTAAR
jgi:hypothetical protein